MSSPELGARLRYMEAWGRTRQFGLRNERNTILRKSLYWDWEFLTRDVYDQSNDLEIHDKLTFILQLESDY